MRTDATVPPAEMSTATASPQEIHAAVEARLDCDMRARIQAHGGDIQVLDVTTLGEVRIRFRAGCVGCHLRPVTLVAIEAAVRDVEGVTSVSSPDFHVSPAARARLVAMFGGEP